MRAKRPYTRMQRLMRQMREAGVAGAWKPGSIYGPGVRKGEARMTLLYGPDGFVISVARPDSRASMYNLLAAQAGRPVILQSFTRESGQSQEIVRLQLSDFLEILAVYTNWLAQEGRLGQDE